LIVNRELSGPFRLVDGVNTKGQFSAGYLYRHQFKEEIIRFGRRDRFGASPGKPSSLVPGGLFFGNPGVSDGGARHGIGAGSSQPVAVFSFRQFRSTRKAILTMTLSPWLIKEIRLTPITWLGHGLNRRFGDN
jgi:hypothetical protein